MAHMASPEAFDAVEVIVAKRDRHELTDPQIDWVIDAYTRGVVADEQMSALAMAVLLNGMNRREIGRWTAAMIASGERMDFSTLSRPTADKHSTGGVGDMITLPLAPLVAACGLAVPQLSGRGLGHTGGTLDKLESIPGWRASLSSEEMLRQLDEVGAVICAAGAGLAPADKKLYALRDVTGTVEAIPLIASSIMSKKIAEGTGALVLDVKVGSGAFMKDVARARELASTMVALGTDAGVRTVALLTNMQTPLGLAAGNAIEVAQAVDVLAGGGPPDVVELTLTLAREMLAAAGREGEDPADALADGRAMDVWRRMILAQGGDPDAPLPVARHRHEVLARPTACSRSSTPSPSGSPPGGSVPAARARRTRSRPEPASSSTPSRAPSSAVASRCSPCSPTPPSDSRGRSTHSRAATSSRRTALGPICSRSSSTGSPDARGSRRNGIPEGPRGLGCEDAARQHRPRAYPGARRQGHRGARGRRRHAHA